MTELQTYIWSGLGFATFWLLGWLLKKLFSNYDKNKAIALDVVENDRVKTDKKIDEIMLIQKAMVSALSSMNSLPQLESFSKQFKTRYIEKKAILKENPELEDIL